MHLKYFCYLMTLLLFSATSNIVVEEDAPKSVKHSSLKLDENPANQIVNRRKRSFKAFSAQKPAERNLFSHESTYRPISRSLKVEKSNAELNNSIAKPRKLFFKRWRLRRRKNNRSRAADGKFRGAFRGNGGAGGTAQETQLASQNWPQQFQRQQQRQQHRHQPTRAQQRTWRGRQRNWQRRQQRTRRQRTRRMPVPTPGFVEQNPMVLPPANVNSGPTRINPTFHDMRHDVVRFRNQVRHIQLIHSDQRLVEHLWQHLHVNLMRFRNQARRARRYNGIILRTNLLNRLRNERNMLRVSSLRMEDHIYRENRRMFRQVNRSARLFENATITNTTLFYDSQPERTSDFINPNLIDIFY